MNTPTFRADALINALNDRSRTTIGNAWKGSYHVAIDVTHHGDTDELLSALQALGVTPQVNIGNVDRIAIYDIDSLKKLRALGNALESWVLERLDTLIQAKGPVPERIILRISDYRAMGWSPQAIANRMNEKRIASGMGGRGWTARKVEEARKRRVPARLRKPETIKP